MTIWKSAPASLLLQAGQIHIWQASLTVAPNLLPFYAAPLSIDEQQRAARFHFQKDTNQFIVGRGILRKLISRYSHIAPKDIVFQYNAHGKPSITSPSKLKFNISHSGGRALFAFTLGGDIGIDIEATDRKIDIGQIAQQFFAPGEREVILSMSPEEQLNAFFHCWTCKEAFIKAHGQGLSLPLDQFEVEVDRNRPAALKVVGWAPEIVNQWDMRAFTPQEGFTAAIVYHKAIKEINHFRWESRIPY